MSEWVTKSFDDVLALQRGHDLPASSRSSGNVPVIGSFGITGCHDSAKYEGPGVAIGRSGASIGKATYVEGPFWPLNTCLFVKDFKGNDPRWIYHLLDQMDFQTFNSGSAQPSLNRHVLRSIPLRVPPVEEQRAIAEVLGALDDKIAANTKLSVGLELLASAEYELARASASEKLRLSDIVTTQYGLTTSAHNAPGPKFLRVTDINKKPWIEWDSTPNCTVSESELVKYQVAAGDILVARMADPGKAAYVDDSPPDAVFASYLVRLKATDVKRALYTYYFLRSCEYKRYAAGAMQGSVQKNMNAKVIIATEIALPSATGLAYFTESARRLRNNVRSAQNENRTLAALRDTLLPELMSGRLRVKDAEKKIEEVV